MARPRSNAVDEATRERLLGAAAKAFGSAGFSAARLEDIAAEAGIRRSSLLYHFDSKQALYDAVLDNAFRELERRMELTMSTAEAFESRLKHVIDALIAFEREHQPLLKVVMRSLLDHDAHSLSLLQRTMVPLVDRIEAFMRAGTGDSLLRDFPMRAAILQQMVAYLVRSAMGEAGEVLWRGDPETWTLAQALLRGATRAE